MVEHTKGPWLLEISEKWGSATILAPRRDGNIRVSDGLGGIASLNIATLETEDRVMFPDIHEEQVANARLIAAAPDLLEAIDHPMLRMLLAAIEDSGTAESAKLWGLALAWFDVRDAAILKATTP